MEPGFLAAVDILVNHYLPESEFARKSAPNQLGLFGDDEFAAAVAPKSRARNLRKPAKGMGAGVFGGSSKKDQEFRDWLDEHGGEVEDMPEGSFNGADAFRKTGVNTRMVVIDKPHDAKQFSRDLAFVLSRI